MALFRNKSESIETLEKACPICHNDVKGNDMYLYFCKQCNIIYRKEDLILTKDAINTILKEKVAEKFSNDKDKIIIVQDSVKEKAISEKKQEILKNLKQSKKYYVSKKSNIIHLSNCPYGKNIKKENKIILKSLEGTEKYKRCKCMTE